MKNWSSALDAIVGWGSSVTYAGRILTALGARFIKEYRKRTGNQLGIIDNGYTILQHAELLPLYSQIAISIDGEPQDHDIQRGKHGAFNVAWNTVLELKRLGYDSVVASVLSPISLRNWGAFEERVLEHDVPLSTTLVWSLEQTKKRGVACLSEQEVLRVFEMLLGGITKLVNLYSLDQVRALAPLLRELDWAPASDDPSMLTAEPAPGVVVTYRPESVLLLSELDLLWDGKIYTHEFLMDGSSRREYRPSPNLLAVANRLTSDERHVWNAILK